ncbi:orotidine-5'-phosphate decarboxylase [Leifsonia naganoensis]|uniref:Orotidine-5'-phosphate decarboxylase n=1 Tax=Leifsonia naganoensis TaxID=150025 RepID=A0A853DVK0_9MICO|nr:orotidine-5'-phosphate decarboxylase [Leifsonia naganoensis]NYK11609.1 orotidine-5'-phosphate decarboxylase [Leifsonia naganoensis]
MTAVGAAFGDRLAEAFAERGRLCVGIDPHAHLLADWGLPASAAGVREFGLIAVEAAAGRAGLVKPQVAFFERFGSAGYAALEEVIAAARAAGLLVIADAKRGDIGTSVTAYAESWLTPGSPLEADALTVSAFQGVGSIAEPMRLAEEHGKGLFVLAATSNPEAAVVQQAVVASGPRAGMTVARAIIEDVHEFNQQQPPHAYGTVGLVLGATVDLAAYGIDTAGAPVTPAFPVLAPGFGHQGARVEDAPRLFGTLSPGVIVSESRGVLSAGPRDLADAVAHRAEEVRASHG